MKIHCRMVGVHPHNRSGFGLSWLDVAELLGSIVEVGWDADQVRNMCTEIDPDDEEAMQMNETL
eukprot:7548262-Karenia_brevis.AAC.1